jgi:hypothetical protein
MKPFKFLSNKKPLFSYEITNRIQFVPESLRTRESWSTNRSELVKNWISDFYFGIHPDGFETTKYFPEIDRVLELVSAELNMETNLLNVTVQIKISNEEYLELDLSYITNHISYH